jgi:inositol-phosphate transport system permease protein
MRHSDRLGLAFLTPALVFVVLFFLSPVIQTAVFSFTNMSTATGISGGTYRITPSAVRSAAEKGLNPAAAKRLSQDSYTIDDDALARAAKAGIDAEVLKELERDHKGKSADDRRSFERLLKNLDNRPNRRQVKSISPHFRTSILNQSFAEQATLDVTLEDLGLNAAERAWVAETSYTGWIWTSDNFRRMFLQPDTYRILVNTIIYVFSTLVIFNTGYALVLAIVTFYLPGRQAAVYRAIWFLPRITPPVIYVLLWKWLAWDTGFISTITGWFGVASRNWMLDAPFNAWVFVVLINGFVGASMGMIIFSSAIKAIPESLFHASEVDGAYRWQQIRHIILPQLRWPILFLTSYQTLSLLSSFELIFLATNGGPGAATEVWSLAAFHLALSNYAGNLQYGLGAAFALVLVLIGIAASLFYLRLFKFGELISKPRIEN